MALVTLLACRVVLSLSKTSVKAHSELATWLYCQFLGTYVTKPYEMFCLALNYVAVCLRKLFHALLK